MKKSIKAALLSALVFPGSGHFMLKYYARGFVLLLIVFIGTVFLMNHVMQQASSIIDAIQGDGLSVANAQSLDHLLASANQGKESMTVKYVTWLLMGCWLFGVVDSYRLGQHVDRKNQLE